MVSDIEIKKQQEQFALQSDLHHALREKEFKHLLQPIVSMSDDTVIAAETPLRLQHAPKGLLRTAKVLTN